MSLHVHLDHLADPFCFWHGDWYYAVATGKAECYSPSFEGPHVVPVFGPWREIGCERGPQLMRSVPGEVIGPGHHSSVTSPEGVDYAVYHAWNGCMTDRLMCVDRLDWPRGVPSIARFAPTVAEAGRPR